MHLKRSALPGMVLMYLAVAAAAFGWAYVDGRPCLLLHPAAAPRTGLADVGIQAVTGMLAGLLLSGVAWQLSRAVTWFGQVDDFFTTIMGNFSTAEMAVMVVVGSTAEELFFRGAIQPGVGLVWQALIFGALHTGPRRLMVFLLPWTLMAVAFGLLSGFLFQYTGTLMASVAAHLAVNTVGFVRLKRRMKTQDPKNLEDIMSRLNDPDP